MLRLIARRAAALCSLVCALLPVLQAQHAVDPTARYYRLICVVPLIGSGTPGDPVRPQYAPTVADTTRLGIVSWSMQFTDDKKMALLHVVAVNRRAFDGLLNDKRPELRVFEVGKRSKDEIETELRKYRKDFDLSKFQVVAQ